MLRLAALGPKDRTRDSGDNRNHKSREQGLPEPAKRQVQEVEVPR